jgi:Low affinity iron permease
MRPPLFDRFAEASSDYVSRAPFFAACVLLVLVWLPSYFLIRNVEAWQLVINSATTIVTFLLVALLQNTGRRSNRAIHHKLDALADGLADLMEHQLNGDRADLARDIADLKQAVGLERRFERPEPKERARRQARTG